MTDGNGYLGIVEDSRYFGLHRRRDNISESLSYSQPRLDRMLLDPNGDWYQAKNVQRHGCDLLALPIIKKSGSRDANPAVK